MRTIGVIGGSGLYELSGLTDVHVHEVDTAFGAPSDRIVEGMLGTTRLLFLPRHGRGHRLPPHRINYRANVLALKALGARQIVSVSAVGSMKESICPGDLVLPDQFIDRTRARPSTFFDAFDVVAHVSLADPIDAALREALYRSALEVGARVHNGGTYICIDGPQFSTRAESNLYRSYGVDVIGMTNMPEARLAREAELPYATLALATDYDCWHASEAAVEVEAVVAIMKKNVTVAKDVLTRLATRVPDPDASPASTALAGALITSPEYIGPEARRALAPILGKYV